MTVRVLLAGWDGLGQQDHQRDMFWPALRQHPGFDVTGVVGEKGAAHAELPAFADVAEAVAATGATLVSVCEQGARRRDVIAAAFAAGADVLVDRPLADTGAEAQTLAEQAERAGRHCIPAYFHRFHPRIRAAGAAVAAGRLGLPWNVQADFFVSGGKAVPEGEIANFAAFPVDAVLSLIGQPVRRVHAVASARFSSSAADDIAVLMLDHAHGITSTVVVGRRPNPGGTGERLVHRYRISGSHGTMLVDAAAPTMLVDGRDGALPDPSRPDVLAAMLDEVHAIVAHGARSTLNAGAAVAAARVIDAARASLANGQPVDLIEENG